MYQTRSSRRWALAVLLVLALYFALGLGRALSTHPWNDEAWYTSPSLSLIKTGNTGTPLLETTGKFWKGINQRTYWVVPLQFFAQVPWFKLFGFSLLSARFYAMAWGILALLSWGLIVYRLTKDTSMALVTALLIACDYQFVSQTSLARMDAMALGLSSFAILLYVELRERSLPAAIFFSQLAVVACGLTHPTAGVPAFAAVSVLTLLCDAHRLRWGYIASFLVPYLIGVAFWGWYISAAPDLFRAQFLGNVSDIDRLGGFAHPFRAIGREVLRYAGMGGFAPGMPVLYRARSIAILIYAIAVMILLLNRATRSNPGIRTLLVLWGVYFLTLTFYDNTKEVKYGIHIVTLYDTLAAVWIVYWWRAGGTRRMVSAAAAFLFVLTNIAGLVYTTAVKDDYHRSFLPAAAFLQKNAAPEDLILASSEFGFVLGFDRNIVDDNAFTYESHKIPTFVVIGEGYRQVLNRDRTSWPAAYEYFESLLNRDYKLVYSNSGYQIFERRERISLAAPRLRTGVGRPGLVS